MTQRRPSVGESAAEVAALVHAGAVQSTGWLNEARLFLELAIPTSLLNFSFTLSPLLTASYVGLKFGKMYLSAFTLANLTGNLFTFSLLAGMFSASDTLSPQAFGKGDYKEVGLIAMRGTTAAAILLIPINIVLVMYLEGLMVCTSAKIRKLPTMLHNGTVYSCWDYPSSFCSAPFGNSFRRSTL